MKEPVWKEKRRSGSIGFPLSKETPLMDLELIKDVLQKNGYEVEIEDLNDAQVLLVVGIKE